MANKDHTDKESRAIPYHASQPNKVPAGAVLSFDTALDAERMQVELWRRMSPVEKAGIVSAISRTVKELSLIGIRIRHPGASDQECLLRLAVLTLGRELACRIYPETAALTGS